MQTFRSDLSGRDFPITERISARPVMKELMKFIQKEHPEFTSAQYLALSELNLIREKYISDYLVRQVGELTELEKTVLNSISNQETLSDKLDGEDKAVLTRGQKIADRVAAFGGSWTFILFFGAMLVVWITLNVTWLLIRFDPYPFILLNLILSCIAAVQAPVIMMSQNRQEEKDRDRARKAYMINLKSELEIRTLHEKVDHMLLHQQQEMLEIQKIQIDMMNEILERLPVPAAGKEM